LILKKNLYFLEFPSIEHSSMHYGFSTDSYMGFLNQYLKLRRKQ